MSVLFDPDVVTLDNQLLNGVTAWTVLHGMPDRALSRASGLIGVAPPRMSVRPRPTGHGGINETRYLDAKITSVEGFVRSWAAWRDINQTLAGTLVAPTLLKWREEGALVNVVKNSRFGNSSIAGWLQTQATGSAVLTTFFTLRETAPGTNASEGVFHDSPAGPGRFQASADVAHVSGSQSLFIVIQAIAVDGTTALASAGSAAFSPGALARYASPVLDAPIGTDYIRVLIYTTAAGARTFDVKNVSSVVGGTALDGSMAGAGWTGTPENSASAQTGAKQRLVKLAGPVEPALTPGSPVMRYEASLYAEDPRAYSQSIRTAVGAAESAGGVVSVTNGGNTPSPWIARIYGPSSGSIPNPRLVSYTAARELNLTGSVPTGSYLELDSRERTLTMVVVATSARTARQDMWTPTTSRWWENPPGVSTIQLDAVGSTDAHVEFITRDAFV